MPEEKIARLEAICAEIAKYRDNTVDGDGNNLHDIKTSFDYVQKYVEEQQLTSTVFGSELSSKATEAGNVLSQLWLCFDNLEKSVNQFCESQRSNNNNGG